MTLRLEFDGLTKRYGAATVLDDVSITLDGGRIQALLGENGAGKSTFIKLIAGVVPADAMTVRKDGNAVQLRTAADAAAAGFRFIHQELNIVPSLSVAENILLSHAAPRRFGLLVDWREMARRAHAALMELDVGHIDVSTHAGALGTGDRMLINLASALVVSRKATRPCLFVFDEPTAALNDAEVDKLFAVINRLKVSGAAILYVSHRLGEVARLCDDLTVLRNGRLVRTARVDSVAREAIVADMTGREVSHGFPARDTPIGSQVVCRADSFASRRLTGVDFALARGEVLGVAGLAGSGQTEVLRIFVGLERRLMGAATLFGDPAPDSPAQAWARGVCYVPQERRSEGLMMRMTVRANALLPHLKGLRARLGAERRRTAALALRVGLKAEGPERSVWQLSGGNQQKVVFARVMAGTPRLLLLDEPTRGVDVGARHEIYRLIRSLCAEGCAVLIASSDLPELLGMCDRILLMNEGRQVDTIDAAGLTASDLLQAIYARGVESRSV